jgi:ABC-type transporter Mla MlaB component
MPQNTAANIQLVLDGALTMRTVEAVRATLRAAVEPPLDTAPAAIAIDCSAAAEIDLTFIQLLIAARVSTSAAGRPLRLGPEPGGPLLDALNRGGFRVVPEPGGGFWFTGEVS